MNRHRWSLRCVQVSVAVPVVCGLILAGAAVVKAGAPHGDMVLLPDDRIILGTVTEVAADQVKVATADVMPRYLSAKQAREKGIWPLQNGDHLHIVVNDQNMVLGYHRVGDSGQHQIIHGRLIQPLPVGQRWAVVRPEGGEEVNYQVRALVRSKLAAVPIGAPAVFLIDETNQIMDTAFGSERTLREATAGWAGSPPKGVNRQVVGTIVKGLTNGEMTIRTESGHEVTMAVRSYLQERVAPLSPGMTVVFLVDDEQKISDVAFK